MSEHVFQTTDTPDGLAAYVTDTMGITGATAHREEIVRCRDCIYWKDEDFCANPQWQVGARPQSGLLEFPCTFPDCFCAWGERRG